MSKRLLIQGAYGGRVEQTGDRRLRAHYPHRFITTLLMFPVVLFSLGAIAMTVGALLDAKPQLLAGTLVGGSFAAALFFMARRRMRTMGEFDLNLDLDIAPSERSLRRISGDRVLDVWPLSAIVAVRQRQDMLHRGFQRAYWLTLEVTDGRVLRLGKAGADELSRTLELLGEWGLPVERS